MTQSMDTLSAWQARFEQDLQNAWGDAIDGSHDLGHVRRVWLNCRRIDAGETATCDAHVLLASAYFHDLVNLPKNAPDRSQASRRSAEAASAILSGHGWNEDRVRAAAHAIEAHSFSASIAPRTQEARVLQDADRLEALGALGIARTFYIAGKMDASLFDFDDPLAGNRPLDDKRFALDHFASKLLGLAATMQTETGRALAEKRSAVLLQFRDQLASEIGAGMQDAIA
ncbi:HD domain protein YedJ [Nitratireductor pacificus pht-3B]|uniref:HD domain protein YedJ n=2 Tax=Nitratireductor TaxID=245876 RepID=K2MS95_9HYPH|nr:HD domain protein YedJ [Nitratireductor pacificus pht-3B]